MRPACDVIAALHHSVNALHISALHDFRELKRAMARDDLAPHPDDTAAIQLVLMLDARTLRSIAAELDVRRAEIERDAVQYLQAAE
jgi:hypothetical protein